MNNSKNTNLATIDSSAGSIVTVFDYEKAVNEATPEQKAHYMSLTRDIRVDNPHSIQNYGQEINKIIAKQADEILNKASSDRNSESVALANQLLSDINAVEDPNKPTSSIKSWLKDLPLIGSFMKDVEKASIKRNTIGRNVDEISKKFESLKVIAMSDNATLETMGDNITSYIYELRQRIVAIMLMKKELEKDVAELESLNVCDLDLLQQKRNALIAISKRITNMCSTEEILKQNMQMVAGLLGNNDAAIDNADMVIGQVIPIWKQQLGLSVMLDNQQAGAEVSRLMREAANRMLIANAQKMHSYSIGMARQAEENFWHIETMRDTKTVMIDTVRQIQQIHATGEANREKIMTELRQISQEYAQALLEAK